MFAVIKSGGRQYKVTVDQRLEVNRLPVDAGEQLQLKDVLLISDANSTRVGAPLVENAAVLATVIGDGRGKKEIVFKYKSKKRYRHRRGHRQELTILKIDDIVVDGLSLITGEPPKAKEAPVEETTVAPETTELDETSDSAQEQSTSRRRRTTPVEDTESEIEE